MWNENDKVLKVLNFELKSIKYPTLCPECNDEGIHVYFHRFNKNDEYGAGWVWCSKCKSYAHVRYKIPSWWKNLESINEDLLEDSPAYLDSLSDKIDKLFEQTENE